MSVLKSINPATEELFAEFKEIDLAAAEEIISKSSASQKQWSQLDINERSKIILNIGTLITILFLFLTGQVLWYSLSPKPFKKPLEHFTSVSCIDDRHNIL